MSIEKYKVAVIGGSGDLGWGLARRLARAGYPVIIGSRNKAKADDAAARILAECHTCDIQGSTNTDAAASAQVILVTVPWNSQAGVLKEIRPYASGKLVIDTTVPLVPPKVARVQLPAERCAALAARDHLGEGIRIVSAFHNAAAHKLQTDSAIDCDILVFGDDPKDRDITIGIVAAIGLRGLHGGPLGNSAAAEALTSILIGINRNYKVDGAGIRITGVGTG